MSRHSPEPWHVGMRPEYDADYITADRIVGGPTGRDEYDREAGVWDVQDDEVYVICQPDDERDARRIVDCVNACLGLTPEQVAALPRLIRWATSPPGDATIDAWKREWHELLDVFANGGGS